MRPYLTGIVSRIEWLALAWLAATLLIPLVMMGEMAGVDQSVGTARYCVAGGIFRVLGARPPQMAGMVAGLSSRP